MLVCSEPLELHTFRTRSCTTYRFHVFLASKAEQLQCGDPRVEPSRSLSATALGRGSRSSVGTWRPRWERLSSRLCVARKLCAERRDAAVAGMPRPCDPPGSSLRGDSPRTSALLASELRSASATAQAALPALCGNPAREHGFHGIDVACAWSAERCRLAAFEERMPQHPRDSQPVFRACSSGFCCCSCSACRQRPTKPRSSSLRPRLLLAEGGARTAGLELFGGRCLPSTP